MKKKALSLMLALAMCLGLTVPAFAKEESSSAAGAGVRNISFALDADIPMEDLMVETGWTARNWYYDERVGDVLPENSEQDGYVAITKDTQFTVTHAGTLDDGSTIGINLTAYVNTGNGWYNHLNWPYNYYLTNKGGFVENALDPNEESLGGLVRLKPGESVTFTLPFDWYSEYDEDVIFQVSPTLYFPGYDWGYYRYAYCKVDDAAYYAAVNKTSEPVSAMPTNDALTCNGVVQSPTVYKIGDSNYFGIRDLAAILNGTEKQFSVDYDAQSVTAVTGEAYTPTGTELAGAPSASAQAELSNDAIYVNGQKAEVEVYKIDGSNYFKLRDLGKALNFYVGWTAEQGMYIETDKPYTE